MSFLDIAKSRQSCRSYDSGRPVEDDKIMAILEAAQLAPSACNSQPYHFAVCRGESAKKVARATAGPGMNKFSVDAPVIIVVSEMPYNRTAAIGAKLKANDYRSIDIGITTAYLTAEANSQGLGSCIMGWFDDQKIRQLCNLGGAVRLVIALGYPKDGDPMRKKIRKEMNELVSFHD